jgi:endo-1,4-beta-xylanase
MRELFSMQRLFRSSRSAGVFAYGLVAVAVTAACASELPEDEDPGSGGTAASGRGGTSSAGRGGSSGTQAGSTATAGKAGSGSAGTGSGAGGKGTTGGSAGAGTTSGAGGVASSGGAAGSDTGGVAGTFGKGGAAGSDGSGGAAGTFGKGGAAGSGSGGKGAGGAAGTFGMSGSGGSGKGGSGGSGGSGTGGSSAGSGGSAGSAPIDCDAPMPTGGTDHCGQNTQGNAGGLAWSLWTNTLSSSACITTFDAHAFSARYSNNGDFLARVGLEFGNNGKPHGEYGTIKADFSYKKEGSGGGYSYIGVYGWTTNPCVEWYIVDDRWGTMPFDAYNATLKGTASMDGANYKLFQNRTTGTGGSRCSGVSQWDQFWSIRQSARQCGTITVSEHFKAWEAAGLAMGGLLEAKILVETGGGTGSIEFPVANVTATQ